MPRRLSGKEWERLARGRHVCVLATMGADGRPVLTPIWYLYRDGRLYMRTAKNSVKTRNIERDPRVSVCIQDERPPYRSATVYGQAAITPEEEGLGAQIARRYLGAVAGAAYARAGREAVERGEEVTIAVTPVRVLTQDFSADTPWYGRLWLLAKRLLPPWL
ncbi:MAG: PPOX class F420-dependent oxidoreductase [Dehalococcoidia bacterium]|nr:PPOX class F420-dependent oxidoreductase [Dehalococcoidia bacterium]